MVIGAGQFAFRDLRSHLLDCGYNALQLATDIETTQGHSIPLAAFAHSSHDSRSACIAVIQSHPDPETAVSSCRGLGAPLVLTYSPDHWEVWKQGSTRPEFLCRLLPGELTKFFGDQKKDLNPHAIYRAKTWARFDTSYQLEFVDVGLMPLVEEEAGQKLAQLVDQTVEYTRTRLAWKTVSPEQGHWLLKSNFWLLAAKILKDKDVPAFTNLELKDLRDVFAHVADHYGATTPVDVDSKEREDALKQSAQSIFRFGNLGLVSSDALAYLYENALIDKEIRATLGTHSTPTYLVDYIVGKLRPWIEEIPVSERQVFEPACGHAAFLLAAMQLLGDLITEGTVAPSERHQYLRKRLHGCDIDSFGLEIARLSLTLADVPNPNGWDLQLADMFESDLLARRSRSASIVLANPPFTNFSSTERQSNLYGSPALQHRNKTAEMLHRIIVNLRHGGVFGVIVPQGLLHSRDAASMRQILAADFEIGEICLLPDKVFTFSGAESAVILGRRTTTAGRTRRHIFYRRVREPDVDNFKRSYKATYNLTVQSERFSAANKWSFVVPDLEEIWEFCERLPEFGTIATIGKGFDFRSREEKAFPPHARSISREHQKGFVEGFVRLQPNLKTHELPETVWINWDPAVIKTRRYGTSIGVPQVLLNYARVSRGPWRLKALIDRQGRPVTSRFLVVRPQDPRWPLEALWGICNSPFANAYSYAFSGKRDVLTGLVRKMPIPNINSVDLRPLVQAVTTYLRSVSRVESLPVTADTSEQLKELHWRIDAEVLRLYDLPVRLERQLLDLFSGVERRGVPFYQRHYFPEGFTEVSTLRELIKITFDWEWTNERREELIDKKVKNKLPIEEKDELDYLQTLTDARIRLLAPLPIKQLELVREELRRRGMWEGD